MNHAPVRYFGVFYSKPYHHLVWLMEKKMELELERQDMVFEIPQKNGKFVRSLHFGYKKVFEHIGLEIMFMKNKGINGEVLVNSKPLPLLLLAGRGDDPDEYFQTITFGLSGLKGVQTVQELNPQVFSLLRNLQFS